MSNYLAIATVTAVFSQKIQAALNKVQSLSAAPQVINRKPEKPDGQMVGVNLYLYDVEFNNSLRNNDLATRRADGSLIQQPQVPLNLKYHISFYGQETTLETQRMMGAVIVELHAQPFITPDEIEQYIKTVGPDNLLAASDLQKQNARIKIEPVLLSMEDVTKMWSSFFQLPHQHSLNYEISVILMESDFPIEKPLPAREVEVSAMATGIPEIEDIEPSWLAFDAGETLVSIISKNLDGSVRIYFEEADIYVSPQTITASRLTFKVPDEARPGANTLRLVKSVMVEGERKSLRSEPGLLIVQPMISKLEITRDMDLFGEGERLLSMEVQPFPHAEQQLNVWLNNRNPNEQHYQLDQPLWLQIDWSKPDIETEDLSSLRSILETYGVLVSEQVRLVNIMPTSKWLLDDQTHYLTLQKQPNGQILCCYGFRHIPSMKALAFKAESAKPGDYMVRAQVDKLKYAQSPLSRDEDISSRTYGYYIGPGVTI